MNQNIVGYESYIYAIVFLSPIACLCLVGLLIQYLYYII